MARYSKIWDISKEQLQDFYDTSNSLHEILTKCEVNATTGGTYRTIKIIAEKQGIDLSQFKLNHQNFLKNRNPLLQFKKSRNCAEEFIENSTAQREKFKKYILKHNIIEYKCNACPNEGFHEGKPLVLHLEHKNGVGNDNRLENLCFLCPNCHSQTSTYCGRNNKKEKPPKIIHRKFDPTKEELEQLVWKFPIVHVAKYYNVSDNAINHRCKLLQITKPPKGYRSKNKAKI
jgi:5-methylcytosine-specific restriction endonuclease McrA